MRRVLAGLASLSFGIAFSGHAVSADDTRTQHRDWARKLETPGGTFPGSLDMIIEHGASSQVEPGGTAIQHRSWIRKREGSDHTNGVSL